MDSNDCTTIYSVLLSSCALLFVLQLTDPLHPRNDQSRIGASTLNRPNDVELHDSANHIEILVLVCGRRHSTMRHGSND